LDQKIPFTSYDFWAYLSSGFLLLFVADWVFETKLLQRDTWSIVQSIVAVTCAYVTGQLVASLSSTLLEKILVGKVLGFPRNNLFGVYRVWGWVRLLLPGYYQPLPRAAQIAALEKGRVVGVTSPGEALFWPAFTYAKGVPVALSRMGDFLNQYGFARNIATVALLDAGLLFWSYQWGGAPADRLQWCWGGLVVSGGMTLRYLKFYRLYAVEVFTTYAYPKAEKP
jgi:hypothetical protein